MAAIAAVPVVATLAPVAIDAAVQLAPVVTKAAVDVGKAAAPAVEAAAIATKKTVVHQAKIGSSIAEKLLLATIIFICLILIYIGYVFYTNSYTTTSVFFFLMGFAGMAGGIYWAFNPVTPQIFGGSDGSLRSKVSEEDEFEDMPDEDIDYLEVNDSHFGGGEPSMVHMLEMLAEGPDSHKRVLEAVSEKGTKVEDKTKAVQSAVDTYSDKIRKANEGHKDEVVSVLEEMKKICIETMAGCGEIEEKLTKLQKSM